MRLSPEAVTGAEAGGLVRTRNSLSPGCCGRQGTHKHLSWQRSFLSAHFLSFVLLPVQEGSCFERPSIGRFQVALLILFPEHVLSGFGHSVLSFRRQFFRIWSGVRVHRTEPFLHQGQKDPAWSRGPVQQSGALSFHLAAPFPACEREQNSSVRHSGTNRTGLVPCA